jgi:copper chaperone CopZ
MTIEGAVTALEGVSTADLDLDSKRLRVQHEDAVDEGTLSASISAAGYTPQTPTR